MRHLYKHPILPVFLRKIIDNKKDSHMTVMAVLLIISL